jgi:hypothetical protein
MSEKQEPYGGQVDKGVGMSQKFNDGSWSIDYSESEKCFYFQVIDYHAGPLKLSFDQIAAMAGIGTLEKDEPAVQAKAESKTQEPVASINKKEKKLHIAIAKGWSGQLTISRKDLYRFGKQMGRRSKLKSLKVS